ncbi:hypothetical protein [Croceibacterium ferulae]|uniref:hypothetical protein n=1 Tax=Croceibacterium ferulae TaxID=1854641 RepID=UPI0019D448BC|nr:hypothetical protein [Croceibacterium ferulae]
MTGLVATALLVGAPTAGWALGGFGPAAATLPRIGSLQLGGAVFTPSDVDPAVANLVARRGKGAGLDRFTPAGADPRTGRTVTVAVRVDDGEARFATVRPGRRGSLAAAAEDGGGLRITPTRYNLGVARGLQSFAKAAPVLSRTLSDAAIPNLADFRPSTATEEPESRFAARIAVEEGAVSTARIADRPAGPRADQTVNVAGSYRLTRNLDVTAGVRYSQQQHRITPAEDVSHKEGQAVYIGTQFRF